MKEGTHNYNTILHEAIDNNKNNNKSVTHVLVEAKAIIHGRIIV